MTTRRYSIGEYFEPRLRYQRRSEREKMPSCLADRSFASPGCAARLRSHHIGKAELLFVADLKLFRQHRSVADDAPFGVLGVRVPQSSVDQNIREKISVS